MQVEHSQAASAAAACCAVVHLTLPSLQLLRSALCYSQKPPNDPEILAISVPGKNESNGKQCQGSWPVQR